MSNAIVEVKGLSRHYGKQVALDEVDFSVSAGQVYGLVGANGAGKTTLLKHLMGLLRPQKGEVRVFGLDPVAEPEKVLQKVGYLSEHRELPEWMRIGELMRYQQAFHPSWDMSFANELIETFRLDPKKQIRKLSQGMRAQTALIAALAHRPELLILDEPSNGLDAVVRMDIIDAIIRTVAEEGRCVIFSSHLLDEMEHTCDHVTMIHEGKVAFNADLDDLKQGYSISQVQFPEALINAPDIPGVLQSDGDGRYWKLMYQSSTENFSSQIESVGGEIVETRLATLEEIFIARVGRKATQKKEAA